MFNILYALVFGVVVYFILKWLNSKGIVNTTKGKITLEQQGVIAALVYYLVNTVF
ncbi:hypothetical protein RJG79_06625 [Mycoplasmatota bacterium WC44]